MVLSVMQTAFSAGELSPSLFGRTDLAKYRLGASTCRNMFVNYRGGASSRAGLKYVGMCKQNAPNAGGTATAHPPRDINFQYNITQGFALEFGDVYMRVKYRGAYVTESTKTITGATQANPCVLHIVGHGYSVGDWVYISAMAGMTNFNGLTWIVHTAPDADHVTLTDLFGTIIDSTSFSAYTSGGTAARIYTAVSPYAAIDLPFLKFTQSANTMSLTCVNQDTGTDYAPYDLTRVSNTNWVFTAVTFASAMTAPAGITATAHNSTTVSTYYSYTVTSVSATGEESIAGTPSTVENNDISVNAGSNSVTWSAATNAVSYNIYGATPSYGLSTPSGVLYGFAGTSTGLNFVDNNITYDFTVTPPTHTNPFPATGSYPGVVAYHQQRRYYANTINNPNTYYASQPGAFLNFDSSIPVTDTDSITGSPWAQQVNGIQFMQSMPSGLIILTGAGAWLLNGGNAAAITASSQTATPEAYNGCHYQIPPIVINYDILYVQSKGSIFRDLAYNFFVNIYTGTDLTVLSNHLFNYHQIRQCAYTEEPYKLVWVVRDDGTLLCLTYLKEQDVYAWTRHDTNGLFVGACSVTEPPVDAAYFIVQRYVRGNWVYYSERMDNRNWLQPEDAFCVDAGLTYPMTFPNATLTPAAADGTDNISSVIVITGGSGYTAPVVTAIDPTGSGSGATFSVTLSGGIITAVSVVTQGTGYVEGTALEITDATGTGAVIQAVVTNNVTFTASSGVFNSGMVGSVIRLGNNNAVPASGVTTVGVGQAVITSYVSSTQVVANITQPITGTVPNDPNMMPVPAISGQWSVTAPVTVIGGLNHLEGLSVAILADGSVVPNQVVVNGQITLPRVASAITIGLSYTCQLQTMYLDAPAQVTIQGKRKNLSSIIIRVVNSRGWQIGTNQIDQSTTPGNIETIWDHGTGMRETKERNALVHAGNFIPLFTGDSYLNVGQGWDRHGQVAFQQSYPLPLEILSCVVNYVAGDSPS